jgi:hypothetical protein
MVNNISNIHMIELWNYVAFAFFCPLMWDSGFIAPWCHKVMKGVEE